MRGIRDVISLVDWLNKEIKDPKTHEWGWDRVAFLGSKSKVRSGETDPRWQKRVDAAEPGLKDLIASRAREKYKFAGANVVPIDFSYSTIEEVEEEEDYSFSVYSNLSIVYQFTPAQSRYHTTERECLAVVKSLTEVSWIVKGSRFPVVLYTDHSALLMFGASRSSWPENI